MCIRDRFKGDIKYYVKESNVLVGLANQAVQTLDKYKTVLDKALNSLSVLEYDGMVSINDVDVYKRQVPSSAIIWAAY